MPPRELPGFYYDESKKKYFRIQQNHVSTSGSAYTQSSVKALTIRQEEQSRQEKHANRSHHGLIKRSPLRRLTNVLQHRIRPSTSVRQLVANTFATHLTYRPLICKSLHALPYHVDDGSFGLSFDIHSSGRLAAVFGRPPDFGGFEVCCTVTLEPASNLSPGYYGYIGPLLTAEPLDSVFGTFTHTAANFLAENTDRPHSAVALARAHVTACKDHFTWRRQPLDSPPESFRLPLPNVGIGYTWQLAASSQDETSCIAVAHQAGLSCITTNPRFGSFSNHCSYYHPSSSNPDSMSSESFHILKALKLANTEQMTATFKDAHVVMSGERSGRLNFTDIRHPQYTTHRLRHPSAITSSLPTEHDHLILVQGLSHLSLYDLRIIKQIPHRNHRATHELHPASSTPILSFAIPPQGTSTHYVPGGPKLAYSAELGLIASASSHTSSSSVSTHRVTLYSLPTGRSILCSLTNHAFTSAVTCLAIARIRDGPESIVTLSGGELLEWTWHDDGGDEDESTAQREARIGGMSRAGLLDLRVEAARAAKDNRARFQDRYGNESVLGMAEEWRRGNRGPVW